MQPILAESVPHRRPAFLVAGVLAVTAALLLVVPGHTRSKKRHHIKCRCQHASYIVVVR